MPRPSSVLTRQVKERSRPTGNEALPWHGGPIPSTGFVASAAAFTGKSERIYRGVSSWQADAWAFYDTTPELRFAAGWIGNALSRCILAPGEIDELGSIVATEDKAVAAALHELFTGGDGMAAMLEMLGIHLTVAGEAYLVGRHINMPSNMGGPDVFSDEKVWEVVGVNEISATSGIWIIDYGSQRQERVQLADDDSVIRIWRPHPAKRIEADSPVRSLLGTLSEIEALSARIYGQTQSQLAGAGVWAVPNTIEFAGADPNANKAEQLMVMMGKGMLQAVADPGDPASLIPFILTVPPEDVDKFKPPIHFWSDFDDKVGQGRKEAVLRFCVGMDIPPEVILGMTAGASSSGGTGTGASHWTAWQIEESAIKLHIEPLLSVIASGIVIGYLRDVVDNPRSAIISNTEALKLQPDRSQEALELYDRALIGGEATRRYNGVKETDVMDNMEKAVWLFTKLAGSSVTPEQVAYAVTLLTGKSDFPTSADTGQAVHPGTNQPDAPSMENHPSTRSAPGQDA